MRRATRLLFLLTVMGVVPAAAQPSEDELVARIEALWPTPGGEAPQAPGGSLVLRCGTSLIQEARTRWSQLSPAAQARLQPLLTPPPLRSGQPRRVETWALETEHFVLQYTLAGFDAVPTSDEDGNQTPDYVEKIASSLEASWQKEVVEMGFQPPAEEKLLVSLRRLNASGLAYSADHHPQYLELDVSLDATEDQRRNQVLEATCAHELFHLSQHRYSTQEPSWLSESTAMWMEPQVFPESRSYLDFAPTRMMAPQRGLMAEGPDHIQYGLVLFMRFVEQTRGGPGVVRDLWEAVREISAEDALTKVCGDLPAAAQEWAVDAYQASSPDYAGIAPMARAVLETLPAMHAPEEALRPEYLGVSLVEIRPAAVESPDSSLMITFQAEGNAALSVVVFDREGGSRVMPVPGSPGPSLSMKIPRFGGQCEKVGVLVMSLEREKPLAYHLSATLAEDRVSLR